MHAAEQLWNLITSSWVLRPPSEETQNNPSRIFHGSVPSVPPRHAILQHLWSRDLAMPIVVQLRRNIVSLLWPHVKHVKAGVLGGLEVFVDDRGF
jgi:hypothetical protein